MAASTSRQPHNISLPPSPAAPVTSNKSASKKSKGKGKEQTGLKRRVGQVSTGSKPLDNFETESTWNWTPIADSSASKFPPVFTKDGWYVQL